MKDKTVVLQHLVHTEQTKMDKLYYQKFSQVGTSLQKSDQHKVLASHLIL